MLLDVKPMLKNSFYPPGQAAVIHPTETSFIKKRIFFSMGKKWRRWQGLRILGGRVGRIIGGVASTGVPNKDIG
ncbi:unnamed protein product [Lactuca virosa]|uniref:Uncharacterized protein n=1 Tax=Lactuca virosa TaxID=75947 RepID=A0AAU9NS53_9ASTR|nr:unnamed protein product [Lactuca virosa]